MPSLRQLVQLAREDRNTNLKEWSYPGVQALLAYRLGRYGRGIRFRFPKCLESVLTQHLAEHTVRWCGIELHGTATIGWTAGKSSALRHRDDLTRPPRTAATSGPGATVTQAA